MPGTGTQYRSPMILQLLRNGEEQEAAESQKNPEEPDHGLQVLTVPATEGADLELVMQWVGVFLQVFWLALLSGTFLSVLALALKLAGH